MSWRDLAEQAAASFGTPCYLSQSSPVFETARSFEGRLPACAVRSWLSFKTHPVRQLAQEWIKSGRGVEVVSEMELVAVRDLGCPTEQLLVNGVAKHAWLHRYLMPALQVHFDSLQEVETLSSTAAAQGWRVGLRCHMPDECDARDSDFGGQFGLSADEVVPAHEQLEANRLKVEGLHFHLGQGTRPPDSYFKAFRHLVTLCHRVGLEPRYIDCGGGIDAAPDVEAAIDDLARSIEWAKRELPSLAEVWVENGRYLTRASAALVVRVLDIKDRPECRYLICDGGRTNHALDADNGPHPLVVCPNRAGRAVLTTLCGPTCMTDDRLGRVMLPYTIEPGDLIVWLEVGAYHLPWETRFSHGLCAVVWCDARGGLSLARARESADQWSALWTATN